MIVPDRARFVAVADYRGRIYLLLAAGVTLPALGLAVFGYRGLLQERELERTRLRDSLSGAAEFALRELDRDLEGWKLWQGPEGIRISLASKLVQGCPWSTASPPACGRDADGREAERLEISGLDLGKATLLYERAALAASAACKPALLLRSARTRAKRGEQSAATHIRRQILAFPPSAEAAAAEFALVEDGLENPNRMLRDLAAGRFPISREMVYFYLDELRRREVDRELVQIVEGRVALCEGAMAFLERPSSTPKPGQIAFWDSTDALVVQESGVEQRLRKSLPLVSGVRLRLTRRDAPQPAGIAVRFLRDPSMPWRVDAVASQDGSSSSGRELFYFSSIGLVLAVSLLAGGLMYRAVRREISAARMQADFVATVSHEFRSPLTGIRQLAELLDGGLVAPEARKREYYKLILQESGRLTRLVENLLDFSRFEAGRKQYHMERIDTAEWLKEIASGVRTPRFSVSIQEHLPAIRGDRDALSSAVSNLIDNALKYSPAEEPVTLNAASENGKIRISVTDRGPGIPAGEQTRVFDKFYRGNGDLAAEVKGAGIGLSLVKRIIEDHGGKVILESREGGGCTFALILQTPGEGKA